MNGTSLAAQPKKKELDRIDLNQSELLRHTLNASIDAMFLVDMSFRFRYVNDAACNKLGYTREELLNMGVIDINPDFSLKDLGQLVEGAKEGNNVPFETRHRTKDGRFFPVEITASSIEYNGEMFALAVVRDITERKHMETLLIQREREFRTLADNLPDIMVRLDRDGRFTYINRKFEQLVGRTLNELQGKRPTEVPGLPHAHFFEPKVLRAIQTGKMENFEHTIPALDGSVTWGSTCIAPEFDDSGQVTYVQVVSRDIGEQKLAEEKMRLAASVFAKAHEGILITDSTNAIIDVNDAFTRITGYQREEVLGKNPRLLNSGRQSPEFYKRMWQSLKENGFWSGEVWNRRKDRRLYAQLLTISQIENERGEVSHYVGVFADITSLKEHEQQLKQIAHFDSLTGIPNRILLSDRLHQAVAHARRSGNSLAICYLDLDGFKSVNDCFGHEAGDRLLIEIAGRMKKLIRGNDTIARIGGDEFVLVLVDVQNRQVCEDILICILQAIYKPVDLEEARVSVSASIGVTVFPLDDSEPDTLLRHADQAMYYSKQHNKNRFTFYEKETFEK